VSRFLDSPSRPFSIHRIAQTGLMFDKTVGEWFGPATIAQVIR
jgi:cysteine protease ATG4